MKEEILKEIGFTENEVKVYLALLELGSVTATEISKLSKVHRTNVYDTLNSLIKKGVVNYILKDKKKYYEATNPNNLLNILKEKQALLEKAIPELKSGQRYNAKKNEVHIYEGLRAIKDILNHFLEVKDERYVLGAPSLASDILGLDWLDIYHKRRIKKKLLLKHIYNKEAVDRIKYLSKLPYTEVRCFSKEYNSPVATEICGDEVVLILWSDNPIIIQIINEKIAKAYKKYFELMWKVAKKT